MEIQKDKTDISEQNAEKHFPLELIKGVNKPHDLEGRIQFYDPNVQVS